MTDEPKNLDEWLAKNDPTDIGGRLFRLERRLLLLSKYPDPAVSARAKVYLKQVQGLIKNVQDRADEFYNSQDSLDSD